MRISKRCCLLVLCATVVACALQLPQLAMRPMHTDEAVHAIKFGQLLEDGVYRYDKDEYHGPTLNYFTLIPAWLSSAEKLTDISEFTLRIVPVFFSLLIIVMLLLLADGLSTPVVVVAAFLTAVSPAMAYYSRYYIQEMLLVCFSLGVIVCSWRYLRSRTIVWALAVGLFAGLMQATKETCIIAFASMAVALIVTIILTALREKKKPSLKSLTTIKPAHLFAGVITAVSVSILFYSSFFSNPAGILASIKSYTTYLSRAGGGQVHIYPWYYYLKDMIFFRLGDGPIWSQALILVTAAIGFVFVVVRKRTAGFLNSALAVFLAVYTVIMTIVYSVIPYKTPWCMLGFLQPMILLAAVAMVLMIKLLVNNKAKVLAVIVLTFGGLHLFFQAYLANYKYYAEPANPYVYAHTSTDIFRMVERIRNVSEIHPASRDMYIQAICPDGDYWPLPWYLRDFTNIGWWSEVDEKSPAAELIIASPAVEPTLIKKLYEQPPPGQRNLYLPLFDSYLQIRHGVELRGFITKELADKLSQ